MTNDRREGWCVPEGADHKAHYFRDTFSLCRSWSGRPRFGLHFDTIRGLEPSAPKCRKCQRELAKAPPASAHLKARVQTHFHVYEYASGGHPRRTLAIHEDRSEAERYAEEYAAWFEEPYVVRGDAKTGFSITSSHSNYQADLGAIRVELCEQEGCEAAADADPRRLS